jgi:hypothetical protein
LEREKNWYSIIQYTPDRIKGEVINIGLIIHNPESGELKYQVLDPENSKIKGISDSEVILESYKINKEVLECSINDISQRNDTDLFIPNKQENNFLVKLDNDLPCEFHLTDPQFSLTSSSDRIFKELLDTYVGNCFFKKEQRIKRASTKIFVRNTFKEYELIGKKIKPNVKIYPFKALKKVPFIIDFVYKNGKINLLQTVPSDEEKLTNWFSQALTITESIDKTGLYYLFDSEAQINNDRSVSQMIDLLKSKGPTVQGVDIAGDNLHSLCKQVQENGKDIDEFEEELIAI